MADKRITDLPLISSGNVSQNDVLPIVDVAQDITNKIEVSQLKSYILSGVTDNYVTGGTYSGGALVLNTQEGNIIISGFTEPFSGGSGNCITDLYVSNLHGCSPITIHDSVQYTGSTASGVLSVAEGNQTTASGYYTHTEGGFTTASGYGTHSEGFKTTASGYYTHAEGVETTTYGTASHAEGYGTVTNGDYQHAQGMWNITGDTTQGAFIIGNGTDVNNRSNLVFAAGNEVNISGKTITTNLQVTSGATNGYVLTSDASGNASWQAPSSGYTYEIGQYVPSEGGVIAHRWLSTTAGGTPEKGSFQNYLVVDTTDLSSNAIWASSLINIPNVESKWNGSENTANIVAAGVGSTAATLCNNSSNNGKTDWYLPAIDELVKMFINRWEIEQGILTAGGIPLKISPFQASYWSSTEFDAGMAWSLAFASGTNNYGDKGDQFNVRAVRKFSI